MKVTVLSKRLLLFTQTRHRNTPEDFSFQQTAVKTPHRAYVAIFFIIIIIINLCGYYFETLFTHFMSFFFIALHDFSSVPCFSYLSNLLVPISFLHCDNLCPLTNRKTILNCNLLLLYQYLDHNVLYIL